MVDIVIPYKHESYYWRDWEEHLLWCLDEFGMPGDQYDLEYLDEGVRYQFQNEQDAVVFSLKWVGR